VKGLSQLRGFTLLELLLTLSIALVVLLVAVPSFNQWIADKRLRIAAGSLQESLMLVRSEAVSSGYSVGLIIAESGVVEANWIDSSSEGCSEVLRCLRWRAAGDIIVERRDTSSPLLRYDRTGRPLDDGTAPVCFTIAAAGATSPSFRVLLRSSGAAVLHKLRAEQLPCE